MRTGAARRDACCSVDRGFGGIEALSRAAGAALEAAQRARDEAAAVEDAASAASALRALHRLLSPPTIASRAVPRSSQHSAGAGGQDGNGRCDGQASVEDAFAPRETFGERSEP